MSLKTPSTRQYTNWPRHKSSHLLQYLVPSTSFESPDAAPAIMRRHRRAAAFAGVRATTTALIVGAASCLLLPLANAAAGAARVGMMYEAWHAPCFFGRGSAGLTVEAVLQSNGSRKMADMQAGMDLLRSMDFYWHKEPADGFYCIFRNRPNSTAAAAAAAAAVVAAATTTATTTTAGEAQGSSSASSPPRARLHLTQPSLTDDPPLPDCPNITATLTRHAAMLAGAGVDFVFVDSTNIQNAGYAADVLQLRPIEVLLEEWTALRAAEVPTPRVVVWQNLQDATGDLWKSVLALYQDPKYKDIIYRDDAPGGGTGKQVLFTTSNPAQELVDEIEASGDVVVVTAWALHDNYDSGELSFFSPCTDSVRQGGGVGGGEG